VSRIGRSVTVALEAPGPPSFSLALWSPVLHTLLMTTNKSYTQSWTILGHKRTARFTAQKVAKNGSMQGTYTDADGKSYKRFFVKPEEFATWTAV
jgi:hypothetical protein